MSRIATDVRPILIVVAICAMAGHGCSTLPKIDPSGEHFFVPTEPQTGSICDPCLVPVPAQPCQPLAADPAYVPSGPVPDYKEVPGGQSDGIELMLTPRATIAPVGTEVVLLAGVLGPDRYLRTNQRIDWSIEEGGVGQFVDLGGKSCTDWLVGDFTIPRKLTATSAVGTTTRQYLRLTRGTPDPNDDVQVLRGQAWITISSPVEGVTYVTALSPCVATWAGRKQTATIHWVNAQWCFPPPAISPAGSRNTFTTSVSRQTDQSPCEGWLVRYEIIDGPPAGFSPDGVQAVEVPTDANGKACVEIFQASPGPGVNRIGIQVIRPAQFDGASGRRLVVGSGMTSQTWSSADVAVRKTGPASVGLGAIATYHIDVSNPGDLVAEGVTLSDEIPNGMSYVSSTPAGQLAGNTVRWQLGQLTAGQTVPVEIQLRADRQGSVTGCAEASIPSGLKARDCVSTTVVVPMVDVQIEGPTQATVGQDATFVIRVSNRGTSPTGKLLIKDRFDDGLKHAMAESPIENDLTENLMPGETKSIGVAFTVTKPGRLCHTVEIHGAGGVQGSAKACLNATQTPAAQPQPQPEPQPQPQPQPRPQPQPQPTPTPTPTPTPEPQPQPPVVTRPQVTLKVEGPKQRTVGETARFTMDVYNTSDEPVSNLRLVCQLDPAFEPSMASPGYQLDKHSVYWTIDSLPAGGSAPYQLEAQCLAPAASACHTVQVMQGGKVLAEEKVCLRIAPPPTVMPPSLSMTIEDRRDPIFVGKESTYEIRVENTGQTPEADVAVVVSVPPEMSVVPLGTTGPNCEIDGQTVRFRPVEPIEPNRSIECRVHVLAKTPGEVKLRAQLTGGGLQQPMVHEEETSIIPAQ